VLSGSAGLFRRFIDHYALGFRFPYGVEDDSLPGFENGEGYLVSGGSGPELVRDVVYASTNANALVNFSTSIKRVFVPLPATTINELLAKKTDAHYVHEQLTPESIWLITHPLDKRPSVAVVDSSGREVYGVIDYLSSSVVRVSFNGSFSGLAYLN
jgi:hypothetical protein